MLAKELKKVIL